MGSADIRWQLITDLRLLYCFFFGVEHVALTAFLLSGTKHIDHLVGYTLDAAWAPAIVATSLTMSGVRGVLIRPLVMVLEVGDVEHAAAESLWALINLIQPFQSIRVQLWRQILLSIRR